MTKPRLCSHRNCNDEAAGRSLDGEWLCIDHLADEDISADLFDDDRIAREREAFLRLARAH